MKRRITPFLLALVMSVGADLASAQREAAGGGSRYAEEAASTGYFRETEPLPGGYQIHLQTPQSRGGFWGLGPTTANLTRESFSADAHARTADYNPQRKCIACHEDSARNLHTARTTVTCRQCHRGQPIAGVHHYYSPLNPIRRHAYVCAKCHEGATANFSSYVVHEPKPLAQETRESFPALFYAVWFMVILAGGIFLFFIPYVSLWGIRDFFAVVTRRLHRGNG